MRAIIKKLGLLVAALGLVMIATPSIASEFIPVYRGGICVSDSSFNCIGGDIRAEPGLGPLVGYIKTLADSGTIPVYRSVCYANVGGECTGWGLSLDVNGTPAGYLSATAPDPQSANAPLVQSNGLLLQNLGGTPSAYLWTVPPPSITSISPTLGSVGTIVTVNGSNFGSNQGTSTVTFNGIVSTVNSWSDTSILAPVPINATTGPIVVTVNDIASNGVTFTVSTTSASDLVVSNLTNPPVNAVAGGSFNLTDTTTNISVISAGASTTRYYLSLDSVITGTDALLTGTRAVPTLAGGTNSTGTVSVTIPSGQSSGTYFLGACADDLNGVAETDETNNCRASTTTIVVSAPPNIANISPASAPVGVSVTITGTNFGASQGASTVTFNGVVATPNSWSNTSIAAAVPVGASSGPVVVTVGGIASNSVSFSVPTKLAITSVNGGSNPTAGSAFSVVVQSQDAGGNPANVSGATGVTLSLKTGTGTLGGTLTGTISVGTNQVTIAGVTYSKAESGVVLTATRTSGDALTAADSASFTINPGAASILVFTTQPANANTGGTISGPPTVTVQDSSGNTVTSSTASITIAIGNNPGGGTLSGTTTKSAVAGVATFTNLSINQSGSGYTLTASATGLTGATSAGFNITTFGQGIAYIYDRLNRLRAVVDLASDTGIYNYDAVGNLLSIQRQASSTVAIIETSTTSGPAGTTVTIYGTGFSTTSNQNSVTFNGTAATVVSSTPTQIVTSVPAGATTGPINVTASGGSASTDGNFTVTATNGAPTITSFTPSVGEADASVSIQGSGFETASANNRVTFNIARAYGFSSTTSNITTAVPTTATSGKISVTTPLGQATSTDDFFVPPFQQSASNVGSTGRMNIGGNSTVNIPSGKNIGMVVFDGTQGQQVTLSVSAVSFPRKAALHLQAPDGSNLLLAAIGSAGGTLAPVTLPSTGTYTISILSRILTRISGRYFGGDGGPATTAHLDGPSGLTMDGQGNIYFADYSNSRIRKIDTSGIITTVAGDGNPSYGGDGGPAILAQIGYPWAVIADGQGNLFIADYTNARVRKINSSGIISTVAGNGNVGSGGDGGLATSTALNGPSAVALDTQGNIFIAEYNGHRIRKVATNGIITTVAGTGTLGYSGDGGLATSAQLYGPTGLAIDGQGNLFIADRFNHRVRKVDIGGVITTVAGTGTPGFSSDGGAATSAQLNYPTGVSLGPQGELFITDNFNRRIRKVDTLGIITTVAGSGTQGFAGDNGPATGAQLSNPWATIVDPSGNLYIADTSNDRIRQVDTSGIITTIAGTDDIGDGGLAENAIINYPTGVAVDGQGNIYVADAGLSRVRKIAPNGMISTFAGDGTYGYGGDGGPATSAQIRYPWNIALDSQGNLYIADYSDSRIRKVDTNGIITTIAGTGTDGYSGDGGPATSAQLDGPEGVAVDLLGNVYIGDTFNHVVRKIDTNGIITTFAGTGIHGYNDDNIPANTAQLYYPIGLTVDSNNNLYIADESNNRVRKVSPAGVITTVAGNGTFGFGGENIPATSSSLSFPQGVTIDSQGNLYIAEEENRVLKVDSSGIISTLTGTGVYGYNGDNIVPVLAQVAFPSQVAADAQGNIFIADSDNLLLRGIYANSTGSMTLTLTTP